MKKKIICIVLMLVVVSFLFAKESIDVVEKNDGNILKGVIIENKIDEYIRIELPGGSIFKVEYGDINTILKEAVVTSSSDVAIVINNTNTNTQSVSVSDSTVTGNPYSKYELDALFGVKSLNKLKKVRVDMGRMADTDESLRYIVYSINKKKNSGLIFLGNFLVPGLGSFIQGNTKMGFYSSLSVLAYTVAIVNDPYVTSEGDFGYYYDDYGNYTYYNNRPTSLSGITIAFGLNAIIAGISGLISPFTYQDKYNKELKSQLMVH